MVKSKKNKKRGASLDEMFGEAAAAKLSGGGWQTGPVADMALDEPAAAAAAPDATMDPQEKQKRRKTHKKHGRKRGAAAQQSATMAEEHPRDEDARTETEFGASTMSGAMAGKGRKATSVVPGLGVVVHSMKRGDHTARQKKRKVGKVKKALARLDKASVKVDSTQRRRTSKIGLKHMY